MALDQTARDERRRLKLIQQRKGPGRPYGLTPVRRHSKRFEAVIWLSFRKVLRLSYVDAGRLTLIMLRLKGPFELLDVGHGYANLQGQHPFSSIDADDSLPRYNSDLKKTALELVKRSEWDIEDRFWLESSIKAFSALWIAAGRNDGKPAAAGMALLVKLGWPRDLLAGIGDRCATLPEQPTPAPPSRVGAFERAARRHRLSVVGNLSRVARR